MNRIAQIQSKNITADVIIVGSGIFGLSLGISLLEAQPSLKVVILERGLVPSGATTKNAGFGMIIGYLEFLDEVKLSGWKQAVETTLMRQQGLKILFKRINDDPDIVQRVGCYDALVQEELHYLNDLQAVNDALAPHFGKQPFFALHTHRINELGFNPELVKALVYHDYKFNLHTGKAVRKLIELFSKLGGFIIWGANVIDHKENGQGHVTVTAEIGSMRELHKLACKKIAFCVNSFQRTVRDQTTIDPGRGQIMVTRPLSNYNLKSSVLIHLSFYYLRVIDGRILFGGGRHLDFEGERTHELKTTEFYRKHLVEKLQQIYPSLKFEPEMFWAGIMGFDREHKVYRIEKKGNNVWWVFGCNSIGMAIGSAIGQIAAEKLINE